MWQRPAASAMGRRCPRWVKTCHHGCFLNKDTCKNKQINIYIYYSVVFFLFVFMVFTCGRTRRDERGCPSLHCLLRGTRSPLSPWLTGLFHGGGDKSRRIHASQEAAATHSSAASPSTKRGPRQQRHLRGEAGPGRGELGSGSAPPRVPAMGRCGGKGGSW